MNEESPNPPQVVSPNVEEGPIHDHEQVHDTLSEDPLLPKDESQSRVKEERKDEEVTTKSEPAAAEVKEEIDDKTHTKSCGGALMSFHLVIPRTPLDLNMWQMSCEGSPRSFHQLRESDPQREPREGGHSPGSISG